MLGINTLYYPGGEESTALRVAPRRAKFIPSLEVKGFLWLICKESLRILALLREARVIDIHVPIGN